LRIDFPTVDIEDELCGAERYVRKKRGESVQLQRRFFERYWLPRAAESVVPRHSTKPADRGAAKSCEPAPDGWRDAIAESVYGPGGDRAVDRWDQLPAEAQQWVRQQIAMKGAT
jgi:hypothetical protein